jgi:arylsulfate sulfotransferase
MRLTALGAAVLVLALASLARASVSVALTPSVASPQPVGTRVIWIAQGASSEPGALDYRFRVRPTGATFRIVRDFHPAPVFEWRRYEDEGNYEIEVTARNKAAGQQTVSSATFVLVSRVSGSNAVISPTGHRLVRLYSAPPCPAGSRIRAIFNTGTEPLANTPWKTCEADRSRNFLIAGLRPNTTYRVMHQLESKGSMTTSAPIWFTTTGLPAWLPFPQTTLVDPPELGACFAQPIVLHANLAFGANPVTMPIATDIFGRVIWYYARFAKEEQRGTTIFRPLPGGNMLMAANDPASALGLQQILREIDLTGSPVRETNVNRISEQLLALGHDPITSIHHDIVQLPNGRLIALASNERVLTDVQGPGDVAVIGDMLIELDEDLQVGWVWNAFDHLDAARLATLDETCVDGQGGCPPVLAPIANDWLHSNSVSYTEDGNLLLSIRHQDWVVKIDYADGTGTGAVLWRLGEGGDFTVRSADPEPWFSHQHDAEFDTPGVPLLTVFDNGNVRRASDPNANSRGQAFYLDETLRVAIPVVNANLGAYAFALGNAERLCNGGFHFHSGVIQPESKAQAMEVGADGRIRHMLETPQPAYRTFRMQTMYQP